jgi:hypothetical protein
MINALKNIKNQWLFWHRWIGLFSCIGVLLWGLSGLSHPIMTRLQPKPVAFVAPSATFDLSSSETPRALLAKHGIDQFQHLSLAQIDGVAYLRVGHLTAGDVSPNPATYINFKTGAILPDADKVYAKHLASHFTGLPLEEITDATLIDRFDKDYHPVNRLLPVWRVTFQSHGHLRAYIDTEQTRLSTLVDDTRHRLTKLFEFGHNWSFLSCLPKLQFGLSASMLGLIMLSALSGLTLYFKQASTAKARLSRWASRRWHRRLGLVVSLTTLVFASSGFFHLYMSDQQQKYAFAVLPSVTQSDLLNDAIWYQIVKQPLAKLDAVVQKNLVQKDVAQQNLVQKDVAQQNLVQKDVAQKEVEKQAVPYWLVLNAIPHQNQMPVAQVAALAKEGAHAEHQGHTQKPSFHPPLMFNASKTNSAQGGVEDFARRQVASLIQQPVSDINEVTWVTEFAKEYGFIFKRLPVLKVQLHDADNTRFYIEPSTGALSVRVRNIDGLEGFVFAYLHKWAFQSLNKELRDVLVSLFALMTVLVGALGIVLFAKPKRL